MPAVLDAYALLAWLQDEPGADCVERWLADSEEEGLPVLVSVVNLGEVYYRLHRLEMAEAAEQFLADASEGAVPFKLVPATNPRVWAAARLKARYAIAYADAFAAALAQEYSCPLVSGDPEFEQLAKDGVVELLWR